MLRIRSVDAVVVSDSDADAYGSTAALYVIALIVGSVVAFKQFP